MKFTANVLSVAALALAATGVMAAPANQFDQDVEARVSGSLFSAQSSLR